MKLPGVSTARSAVQSVASVATAPLPFASSLIHAYVELSGAGPVALTIHSPVSSIKTPSVPSSKSSLTIGSPPPVLGATQFSATSHPSAAAVSSVGTGRSTGVTAVAHAWLEVSDSAAPATFTCVT